MSLVLKNLQLLNFRSYDEFNLDFSSDSVVFCGPNGIGKTNLLEAIFFLSILRSFRTSNIRDLLKIGRKFFRINGEIVRKNYTETVSVEQSVGGSRKLSVDGAPVRRSSEFIREFRTVAFVPEDKLVTSGSSRCRRKFFDMLISVLEPVYFSALQQYGVALAQRNAALRSGSCGETVSAFEPVMSEAATMISSLRRGYAVLMERQVNELLDSERFQIVYQSDDPESKEEYLQKLRSCRQRDQMRGFTAFGPQVDEFLFYLDGKMLRSCGSNGQLRLMSLYLKMSEFALIRKRDLGVIALVDDVTGELDGDNRGRFFSLLNSADQRFYTFTDVSKNEMAGAQVIRLGR